jgi:hypothetical protein
MEKNHLSFFCRFITDYNKQNNYKIIVSTENDEIILPYASKTDKTIYLTEIGYTLILLNSIEDYTNFINILLAVHMIKNDKYDYTKELLNLYNEKEHKIINACYILKADIQMFVITLHELAHCLFYIDENIREEYFNIVDTILQELSFTDDDSDSKISMKDIIEDTISDPNLKSKFYKSLDEQKELNEDRLNKALNLSVESTQNRNSKKEEYAADLFALNMFYETYTKSELIKDINNSDYLKYAFDTFIFLQMFNNIEDKIDLGHNKRSVTFRASSNFDVVRMMLAYGILDELSEGKIDIEDPVIYLKHTFKKLFKNIMFLADKKFDKYLEITSKGSGIIRNEQLFKEEKKLLDRFIFNVTDSILKKV